MSDAPRVDWVDQLRSIHIPDPEMPHLCQMCGAEDGDYPCSILDYLNDDLVRERAEHAQVAESLAAEVERLRNYILQARFYPVRKPGQPDDAHWMYCADCGRRAGRAEDVMHTQTCGAGAALGAKGAGDGG